MNNIREPVAYFVIFVILVAVALRGGITPDVYMAEGKCKAVKPEKAGTCDNLPDKYDVIHVSPEWRK